MKSYIPWGKSVSINLGNCDHASLSDPKTIKTLVNKIIKATRMKAYGPCRVQRFGKDKLEGYSAMQFIETSTIVVHCDELGNRAFVDVFSCKYFYPDKVKEIAASYFSAQQASAVTLDR
jgi:S-adenosylmethionine decarboxylase